MSALTSPSPSQVGLSSSSSDLGIAESCDAVTSAASSRSFMRYNSVENNVSTNNEADATWGASTDIQHRAGLLLFHGLADLLLILDQHRHIIDLNPAAEKFFELDRNAIATCRLTLSLLITDFSSIAERVDMALSECGCWDGKLTVSDQHGIARRLDITLRRISYGSNDAAPLTLVMCRDITEQHRRRKTEQRRIQQSMRDSELRFWRVADAAPVMIWQTDSHGNHSYINRRLREFIGGGGCRECDTDWRANVHPEDRARCQEVIQRAVLARENFEIDYRLRQHDGTYRWLVDKGMPRYGSMSLFEGYVGSCIDVTPFKKLEQTLQRKTSELVDAAARKDAFLAMLSHELRNPLAPIANSLAVMRAVRFPDALSAASFAIIERQFNHLSRLVNELLDIDRISSGKIAMHRSWVSVQHIVECALEISMPAMHAAHHQLIVDVKPTDLMVYADPMRLAQAVANVLDNAAKFTREHGIIAFDVGVVNANVFFAVRDNGIGFAADFAAHLFAPFAQADRSLARTRSGLGIGLAMAHQIVQLHEGTITASSDGEGCGSRFVLSVPILSKPVEHAEFSTSSSHTNSPTDRRSEELTVPTLNDKGAGFRILLVDDNEDANDSMAALLELLDYDVRTATDGATALKTTSEFQPQLILSDIGLPGMDGYELAPALRKAAGSRKLVIAAATGYGHASDRARSLAAGFDHHLVKPLDADALLEFVAQQAANY